MTKTISPYEEDIATKLDAIEAGIGGQLTSLGECSIQTIHEVLKCLVQFACCSQNTAPISLARKLMGQIPEACLNEHLYPVILESLDLSDEWEYRRGLELLREVGPVKLDDLIAVGRESMDEDIRGTAEDFAG